MPRSGNTKYVPNPRYAEALLRSAPVETLVDSIGDTALGIAKATAPVDSGEYRDELHIEHHDSRYRRAVRVVGSDPKTLIIEAKRGILARALKAAKKK